MNNNNDNDNWSDIRGKKINIVNQLRKIDFSLMFKRIQIIVNKELVNITWNEDFVNLPNKYASWIVK